MEQFGGYTTYRYRSMRAWQGQNRVGEGRCPLVENPWIPWGCIWPFACKNEWGVQRKERNEMKKKLLRNLTKQGTQYAVFKINNPFSLPPPPSNKRQPSQQRRCFRASVVVVGEKGMKKRGLSTIFFFLLRLVAGVAAGDWTQTPGVEVH